MKVKITNSIELFAKSAEESQEIYYLTDEFGKINDYLENSGLDDDILMNIKIAYNLKLKGYILDTKDNSKRDVSSIKETIEKLNFDYTNQNLILKFDDIDKKLDDSEAKLLTDVIQQFIFLGLDDFEIFTEQERRNKLIYEKFRSNSADLKISLSELENKVLKYETDDENIVQAKKSLEKHINKIKEIVKNTKERKLIISVVALRNAGKSVIVNSFLGEEFAPTSEEDSTPNAIVYESWNKNYIELKIEADVSHTDYKKETIEKFKTTKEVYEYLSKKFKDTNLSEEKYLPDIYIRYPGSLDYIIVDTPGPNKIDEHANVSEKWLEKSDAVILAIEYGDNEEKQALTLLKKVQQTLRKKDKLQSLLVVANKLDRMYDNEHSKSKVRYLDKSLTYLNREDTKIPLIMMPISALEYFYMNQYIKILHDRDLTIDDDNINKLLSQLTPRELKSKEKTIRSFIGTQARRLEDFHYNDNVKIKDIIKHSNMEALKKRVEYIATNKAFDEIFSSLFYELDQKFTSLENEFLSKEIARLKSYKDEIETKLDSMSKFFEEKQKKILDDLSKNSLDSDIIKSIDDGYSDASRDSKDKIDSEFLRIKSEMEDTVKENIDIDDILNEDFKKSMGTFLTSTINKINSKKNNYVTELEDKIIKLNKSIKQEIIKYKFEELYNLKITLTELSPKLRKEKFLIDYNKLFSGLDWLSGASYNLKDSYDKKDNISNELKEGVWNKLLSLFGKGEYEEVINETKTTFNPEKAEQQLQGIKDKFIKIISDTLEKDREESKNELGMQLDEFVEIVKEEMDMIINSYEKTNRNIKKMLNEDKATTEERENFFVYVTEKFNFVKKIVDDIKQVKVG